MTLDASLIGYVAAACTTCSFIPQVVHTLRTRDTSSISLGMYSLFVGGVLMWLAYGMLAGDIPIVIANLFTATLASIVLAIKIKNRNKDRYQ